MRVLNNFIRFLLKTEIPSHFSGKQEKMLSEESRSEVLSQHMSQLCASSKVKLDSKQRSEEDEKSSQACKCL